MASLALACQPRHAETRPSLILISVDTLRADRLSLYGYERPTTPHLDRWAKNATIFENTVAQASWTVPSHLSIFTGLDAWRHGFNHDVGSLKRSLAAKVEAPLLAERLQAAGYVTAAETGGAYLDEAYGFGRGFDTYAAWPRPEGIEEELETIVDRALDFDARHRDEPYFFFLHTYDVHDPYACRSNRWSELTDLPQPPNGTRIALNSQKPSPDNGFRKQNSLVLRPARIGLEMTQDLVDACYDAGVARMDAQIGRLIEQIRSRPGRQPLIILTSDHGEALGEDGRIGHNRLEDSNLLVPLIIADPSGRGAGLRVERQVRLIDILPSVLELLNLPAAEGIDGHSLVPFMDGQVAEIPSIAWSYSATGNRGVSMRHGNRMKAILPNTVWSEARAPMKVYDLRADPDEVERIDNSELEEGFRTSIDEAFTAQAVGLRLHLQNASDSPLEGRLSGPSINAQGIKSMDLECPCLTYVQDNEATFKVPPGQGFTLHFERILGNSLDLEIKDPELGPTPLELRTDELQGAGGFLRHDNGFWVEKKGVLAPGETGLVARWHGIGAVEGSPVEYDPELRRQLESLGYL